MKKAILISLIIISCTSNEVANEDEKEWCMDTFWKLYGEIPVEWEDGEVELTFSFHESFSIYEDKYEKTLDPAIFRMELKDNDNDYMKVCKIWFDTKSSNDLKEN